MRAPFFSLYSLYYALFRPRTDGDWDFFPCLRWGRGYRANALQRTDLIDSMLRYDLGLVVSLSIVLALATLALSQLLGSDGATHKGGLAVAMSFVLFIGAAGITFLLRLRNVRRLVKGLPPAETALKAVDEYALLSAQLPNPAIVLMMILGLLGCIGTVMGIFYGLRSGEWGAMPLLVAAAAGFGVMAWYCAQTWRHRVK